MKWIFYIIALTAAILLRPKAADVAKLQPVEVVMLYTQDAEVVLKTDTGDYGRGVSAEAALRDLKKTTPGTVYLDTAEYLLVPETDQLLIEKIEKYMKEDVLLCCAEENIDLVTAAKYLDNHPPKTKLSKWKGEEIKEILVKKEDRLEMKNK